MAIVTAECHAPILNLFTFSSQITADDLNDILTFHAARHGDAAGRDEVLLFESGTDMSTLTASVLKQFKRALGAVLQGVRPAMVVRTALVCRAPACRPALEAWAGLSSPDDGFHTEVRLVATVAEAAAWIGLDADEAARVDLLLSRPVAA